VNDFKRIGKFDVIEKLGQGSFGTVYRGRDPDLKRDVAIKVCSIDDEGLRKRFLREAEISGNLQHKNIVTIFAFGYEQETPYLVQEFLPGEDLRELIRRKAPLASKDKIDYLERSTGRSGWSSASRSRPASTPLEVKDSVSRGPRRR